MELIQQRGGGQPNIQKVGAGYVVVDGVRYAGAIAIHADGQLAPLSIAAPEQIDAALVATLLAASGDAELVLIGSRQGLLPRVYGLFLPQQGQANATRRIGIEMMQLDAAARTYHVLISENRRVLTLLFS
jgi:uncharacterized protein